MIETTLITTKLGRLKLYMRNRFIIRLFFENDNPGLERDILKLIDCESINNGREFTEEIIDCHTHPVGHAAAHQINEYAERQRQYFELPLMLFGINDLTKRTAEALQKIPYGRTIDYTALANQIDCKSVRAVGTAVGQNPLPIFIPCHRVILSSGKIGGYRGGIEFKKKLLMIEDIHVKG